MLDPQCLAEMTPLQKAIFYIFGIHENACDFTQNALIPQLLGGGDFAPDSQRGLCPLHIRSVHSPQARCSPPTNFWIRHCCVRRHNSDAAGVVLMQKTRRSSRRVEAMNSSQSHADTLSDCDVPCRRRLMPRENTASRCVHSTVRQVAAD